MNEEFLVEPSALKSTIYLRYIMEQFGFHEGRFVGEMPSTWKRMVYEEIDTWPDGLRKQEAKVLFNRYCAECLSQLEGGYAFMPLPTTWVENAAILADRGRVAGVVVAPENSSACKPGTAIRTIDDVDADFFGNTREVRVAGTSANYVALSSKLIKASGEIALIDSLFDLYKTERLKVLQAYIDAIKDTKCKSLVLWTRFIRGQYDDANAVRKQLQDVFGRRLGYGRTLTVKIFDDSESNFGSSVTRVHTRLVLSTKGGLRFDHGLQDFRDKRMVDVIALDRGRDGHEFYRRWFLDVDSPNDFAIVQTHVISGA